MGVAPTLTAGSIYAAPAARAAAQQQCPGVELLARTTETIQMIEKSWLESEVRGNAAFLDCLFAPDYSVISVRKDKVITNADLLRRVATAKPEPDRQVPDLWTKVAINGDFATAYSWIEDAKGQVTASYVDFYRYAAASGRPSAASICRVCAADCRRLA